MKRILKASALCLSLLLFLFLLLPQPAQGQMMNALTRAMLQASNFAVTGTWTFTGAMYVPSGTSLPATCSTTSGASRFFFLTTANAYYQCTATNTWTSAGSSTIPNPFTNNQTFSGTVDLLGTTNITRQQTIEVCKVGCGFSTIAGALASIVDATAAKPYVILIHGGQYDENVTAISYVRFRGTSKDAVRWRGVSSGGTVTLTVPVGITDVSVENLTIGGTTPILMNGAESSRTTLRIKDAIVGIIDGTESSSGKSTKCINDTGSKHDIFADNVECRSRLDGYIPNTDTSVTANGGRVDLDDKGTASSCMRGFTATDTGAQITVNGTIVTMTKAATACGTGGRSGGAAVEYDIDNNNGTRPTLFTAIGMKVSGVMTGTPGGAPNQLACLNLASLIGTQQSNSRITYLGVDCDLDGGASSWSMRGITRNSSDTDWASVPVRWTGGSIKTRGGATNLDAGLGSSPISGELVEMIGIAHSGTYSTAVPASANLYSVNIPQVQRIQVCKTGGGSSCPFNDVNAAVASISDAADSKRYTVDVAPGDYQNDITPKSFVTVHCRDKFSTRIRSVLFAGGSAVTNFAVENCNLAGQVPVHYGSAPNGTSFAVTDCILGSSNGTVFGDSLDGFANLTSTPNTVTIVSRNNIFRSFYDTWNVGRGDTIYDDGSRYELITHAASHDIRVVAWSDSTNTDAAFGAQMFINHATILGNMNGSLGTFFVFKAALNSATSPIGPARFMLSNSTVDVIGTDSNTLPINGIYLDTAGPNTLMEVLFNNVDLRFRDTGGTRQLTAININSTDADHANWKIRWHGGSIELQGAGAKADVINSDNTAGFVIELADVKHSGTYTGSVPPTTMDTVRGKFSQLLELPVVAGSAVTGSGFISYDSTANDLEYGDNGTNRKVANLDEAQTFTNKTLTAPIIATISNTGTLTLPTSTDTLVGKATTDVFTNKTLTAPLITLADLAVGTCTQGQLGIDNGGATKEWCVCGTTNTWGCWKLTDGSFNANGPAD